MQEVLIQTVPWVDPALAVAIYVCIYIGIPMRVAKSRSGSRGLQGPDQQLLVLPGAAPSPAHHAHLR